MDVLLAIIIFMIAARIGWLAGELAASKNE